MAAACIQGKPGPIRTVERTGWGFDNRFANRFLREGGRDVAVLQPLLGHSRIDTTQLYTDEIELDELTRALENGSARPSKCL